MVTVLAEIVSYNSPQWPKFQIVNKHYTLLGSIHKPLKVRNLFINVHNVSASIKTIGKQQRWFGGNRGWL